MFYYLKCQSLKCELCFINLNTMLCDKIKMECLIKRLFDVKVIKFGDFQLKSGLMSPLYLDLRELIGYPDLMNELSKELYGLMSKKFDQICGVPYTALPIASCISVSQNIPMVIKRKESKDYGTKKLVEGVFEKGMSCCIIEDVITTGSSVLETAKELKAVGLDVTEAVVIIDRCQGGRKNLIDFGISVNSLLTLTDILQVLVSSNKITDDQYKLCIEFIEKNQCSFSEPKLKSNKINKIGWDERISKSENKISKKIFEIINIKKTNLCVAADVKTMEDLLVLAKKIAPFICILKVHADIINDFDLSMMRKLKKIALENNFLLMEDRKFSDIGNTVNLQLSCKHFDYLSWCDLLTVHAISGYGIFEGIRLAANERDIKIGCLIVAEMSSTGSLTNSAYKKSCSEMALLNKDIVVGFVSQSLVIENNPELIHCTPGVHLKSGTDNLGQNYRSVSALKEMGFVDIFIVGRAISEAEFPDVEAALFQQAIFTE